jgi:hypothetical protein
LAGLILLALALPLGAQEVTVHGQVRPRHELRDPAESGGKQFTSMRVRASIDAALENDIRVFIQLQDVRFWGEEMNTLGDFNADNFDLHQGYVEIKRFNDAPFAARVGRQEVNLGGQRLVGAVGWTQQGRSFDGVRARFNPAWGSVELMGYQTMDLFAQSVSDDATFWGAYAVIGAGTAGNLDLYAFHQAVESGADTDQTSFGARFAGKTGKLSYRGEATVQTGTRVGDDVSAYMLGGRLGLDVGKGGTITLWYDLLSGDADPTDGETKVFDTMFATNHKFYGFADLFLNIPAHTGGQGLQDLAVKGSYRFNPEVSLGVDLHTFSLVEQRALASSHLGEEIDATLTYRYTSNLTFQGGFSWLIQDDAWADIGRLTEDMTWGYLMINVVF